MKGQKTQYLATLNESLLCGMNPTLFPFFFFPLGVWLVILRKFLMRRTPKDHGSKI